jgi:hypothetical protein
MCNSLLLTKIITNVLYKLKFITIYKYVVTMSYVLNLIIKFCFFYHLFKNRTPIVLYRNVFSSNVECNFNFFMFFRVGGEGGAGSLFLLYSDVAQKCVVP